MTRVILVIVLTLPWASALADWRVAKEQVSPDEPSFRVALVENDSGHSLKIYQDVDGMVRGIFTIRDGFDTLAENICPTYRIDERTPASLATQGQSCQTDSKHSYFPLGTLQDDQIRSNALLQLMNGTYVLFRYHLRSVGYRETRFSLGRSKQILLEVLGQNVAVLAEEAKP